MKITVKDLKEYLDSYPDDSELMFSNGGKACDFGWITEFCKNDNIDGLTRSTVMIHLYNRKD